LIWLIDWSSDCLVCLFVGWLVWLVWLVEEKRLIGNGGLELTISSAPSTVLNIEHSLHLGSADHTHHSSTSVIM